MKHIIQDHHKKHLLSLGLKPKKALHVPEGDYQLHYAEWQKTLPHESHEVWHMKALGHAAWKQKAEKKPVRWGWFVLGLLALLFMFALPAHCQFSKINSISLQNSNGSPAGYLSSPFTLKAGASCTWTAAAPVFTFNCSGVGGTVPLSIANASHKWINSYDAATGLFTQTQPAYSDISSTPQLAVTKTCSGTDKVSAYDSSTGLFTCTTDATGAGGSTPTGTGFRHVTGGTEDGAAAAVNVSGADITGVLKAAAFPAEAGDVTNSAGSLTTTVGKVNGVTYSSGPATDTTPVITAANTSTYSALPTCTDTVGKHLNYDTSTHTYSCGTSVLANSEIPLGCATNGATPGLTIGPLTIAANKLLRIPVYISSYAGGGSTALMTFNGAGGTAYRFRWLTAAAAATTFTAGASNPPTVSTAGIRLGADNTTLSRNNVVFITNDPANTEKLVLMEAVIGSGSAATQAALTFGNGAWVSGAATSITSVTLTAGSNMGAGSGFCVFGSTF